MDRHLAKKWKMFCKLHFPKICLDGKKKYRLCSDHFTTSDFRRDLQAEMLGKPTKNILNDNAVPSLRSRGDVLDNATFKCSDQKELVEILLGNIIEPHVTDEYVEKLKIKYETQVLTLHQESVKRESLNTEIVTLKKTLADTNAERDEFRKQFKKVRNCYNKLKCTTKKKLLLETKT
jgi:hypothetical protein